MFVLFFSWALPVLSKLPAAHACWMTCDWLSAQGKAVLGLELLAALAEEGDCLDRRRRTALLPLLARRSPEVFGLLSQALSGHLTAGRNPAPCSHILTCMLPSVPLQRSSRPGALSSL